MIKDALIALRAAAQTLVMRTSLLPVFILLYIALLVACYLFITTKEATAWQLLLTALAALSAPALFFLLQGASVNYTRTEVSGARSLLRFAAHDALKLVIVSLPFILLGAALIYLLAKMQTHFTAPPAPETQLTIYPAVVTKPNPIAWSGIFFTTLRLLLVGILLPLLTIHAWLAVARHGIGATVKNFPSVLRAAFAPRAVTIFALGLLIFGALPYFLIFTRTPVGNAWAELIIFGARLSLTFALTLAGWVVTIGALAVNSDERLAPATSATPDTAASQPPMESAPATS